jgi:uncharacterized membrane protein
MQHKNIYAFNINWNFRTTFLFIFLLALPNLLSLINISTPFGFKIHFFQLAVFIAALIYGPKGGLLSGFLGSIYPAFLMGNPYIIFGNAILGFFVGLLARRGFNIIFSVWLAYLIQLPFLLVTDYYFIHLPIKFLVSLVIALAISNTIWAVITKYTIKPIRKFTGC